MLRARTLAFVTLLACLVGACKRRSPPPRTAAKPSIVFVSGKSAATVQAGTNRLELEALRVGKDALSATPFEDDD
jgi:hypothetical protein